MPAIALLIPALDEEDSMARTAAVARQAVDTGLVSSATVLDGGSTDRTADIARAAGIDVLHVPSVMPELGAVLGKGDSMFRGVRSIHADWYVFMDADLGNVSLDHVQALVEPVGRDGIVLVKGGFVRVDEIGAPREIQSGRVTEEVGRPLLRCALPGCPQITEMSQPLSGQVAVRGDVARSIPFVTGYGVEIAMLIDIVRGWGAQSVAVAGMGDINNRWKDGADLEPVMRDVAAAAALRGAGEAASSGVTERHPAAQS